eukprot:COSAG05_NODE_723_length_7727_cov_19.327871_8_plen_102_part_00
MPYYRVQALFMAGVVHVHSRSDLESALNKTAVSIAKWIPLLAVGVIIHVTKLVDRRYIPIRGWSSGHLLPTDRTMFSHDDGVEDGYVQITISNLIRAWHGI